MVAIKKDYLKMLQTASWINRMMIALVYVWFGFLKILGTSPAEGLVSDLFNVTLSGLMSPSQFVICLGVFECVLGLIWLFPSLTKIAFYTLIFHLITTFMPIVLLPNTTWTSFFSLTLVGQYIVKNVVLLGAGYFVYVFNAPSFR
ncbi:hypothetical protein EOJ36_06895 [Sandaracinomonas limnophila]|uniref:DoxX family protein n=1 Tax=Sandaracinomonas limnophila TaxID=1862386 RepID=A0A437PR51_9BACT|nr:hypothetical protein [Sandaracinomonas limnophila]RVU24734.1 hypothetical protein EOJ36_06895 [Sandaracinomonas limnophila]